MKKQNTTHDTSKGEAQAFADATLADLKEPKPTQGDIDWAKVDSTTEEDIERHAREDGEEEWTPEMLRRSHMFRPRKRAIHIMVDPDVLDFFQRQGRGYQSRINAVLRSWVEAHQQKAS